MSVSSRDEEKDTHKPRDHVIDNEGKKYLRIWRIEASREFVLLFMFLLVALAFFAYNPLQVVQNTDKIIENQNFNWNKMNQFIDNLEKSRTVTGMDIIKLILLYDQDNERDIGKIMNHFNISNTHFVDVNGTHAITEKGSFKLPYAINMSGLYSNITNGTTNN